MIPDKTKAHDFFMSEALKHARNALESGEFPVGCVIVGNGEILSYSSRANSRQTAGGETRHAEIIALENLERDYPSLNRKDMTIYCTMEPCLMCFGAILISGIKTIVYAYEDAMGGGTSCDLSKLPPLYSDARATIVPNVMRDASLRIFKDFFSSPSNTYLKNTLLAEYTLGSA